MRPEGRWDELGEERSGHAVQVGRADANRDEGEHVQSAIDDRSRAADEEGPSAPEHRRRREDQLDPQHERRRQRPLNGLARDHVGHREQQHGDREGGAHPEPPRHVSQLRVDLFRQRHRTRLEGHAADGARAGRIPDDLLVHRADVLRLYHRRAEIHWLEGHSAVRTGARLRPSDLGMHRAGVRGLPDRRSA